MSYCTIKTRKAKVKLIYENTFDFSFNDSNECIFESARNEIKLMLQQELEFFLSKLKLKINDVENPFLVNCEKCRISNPSEVTDFLDRDKHKNNPTDEFDDIFHIILDGNNSKKTYNNQSNINNPQDYFSRTNKEKKTNFNSNYNLSSVKSTPAPNINIKFNQTKDFSDLNMNNDHVLQKNTYNQNFVVIVPEIQINSSIANNNFLVNQVNKDNNNSNINFLKPSQGDNIPKPNENLIFNLNNSLNNDSLKSNRTEKDGNNFNTTQKTPNGGGSMEKEESEKNNIKEEHDDDLSSIHSNQLEPNFLKGAGNFDGRSLNSYENLTVLEEAKSDKEAVFAEKHPDQNFREGNMSQKKMKIGSFMDDNTGKQIDLLICDNFKSRYESSIHPHILKNTSQFFSTKQLNILQKNKCVNNNHKIYLLYGNIAYSMGTYQKALKFYQTGISTIIDENKDSPDLLNYVIFKSLLQNNLAKCMINTLNIKGSIYVLENAIVGLNEKLICYNEEKNQNLASKSKHFIYKLHLLKIIIEFNLAEAYYCLEDYKQSTTILEKIFEDLTSENTVGYYESHNEADLSYDDKEISRFFVKYYYISGKIQYRLDNLQLAMDSFNQSINLRDKTEHKEDLAQIYNYISLILCKQEQFDKALKFINKAYNIYWLLYGEEHIKTNMISLNLSHILKMKGENLKCIETLNKCRETFIKSKDTEKIFGAIIHRAIGTCFFEMENEIKGLAYYSKANNIYKKYFISHKITMNEINMVILNLFGLISI